MQHISELFRKVFTPYGAIRHHSKAYCKELILRLQQQCPTVYYGNAITGRMNVSAVVEYGKEHGFIQDH